MADKIEAAPPPTSGEDESADQDELRSKALAAELETLPEGYFVSPRFIGTFLGTSFALASTYFVLEAAAAVIPIINEDIGPSNNAYLFSIVWSIAQAVSILLFGRNSDLFGRRNIAIGANLLGIVGGIVACTSQGMNQLIAGNAILGLAAGVPGSYPLLTGELVTNKMKMLGTMIVVVPNIIATGFGPYLGIRLALLASWRWIFYIYIILTVCGTIFWWFFYFPPSFVQMHGEKKTSLQILKNMDYVGSILLSAGLVLLMLGISWGGTTYPWKSGKVLGLIVGGIVTLILFVFWEIYRVQPYPIVPMHLWTDVRGFTCVVIISGVMGCLQLALYILWPSEITFIYGSTASSWEDTAWMSSVINLAAWGGIMLIGPLFGLLKHLRTQLIVASIWMTAFLGACATISLPTKGRSMAFAFLAAFPMGWGEIFTMLMVQFIVSERDLGVGFAIVCAIRLVFSSIFSAIFIAIYTNKLPGQLQAVVAPAVEKAGLSSSNIPALFKAVAVGSQDALKAVPGMNDAILKITNYSVAEAYSNSYAYVFYTAVALGGLCLIASCSLRDFDRYLTDHVARQVYHKKDTKVDILRAQGLDHAEYATPAGNSASEGEKQALSS